jgi:hypothetical protein
MIVTDERGPLARIDDRGLQARMQAGSSAPLKLHAHTELN